MPFENNHGRTDPDPKVRVHRAASTKAHRSSTDAALKAALLEVSRQERSKPLSRVINETLKELS